MTSTELLWCNLAVVTSIYTNLPQPLQPTADLDVQQEEGLRVVGGGGAGGLGGGAPPRLPAGPPRAGHD